MAAEAWFTAQDLVSAAAGLVGALIGGGATLWASGRSRKHQIERDEQAATAAKNAFLTAIRDEIAILWAQYRMNMGRHIEQHTGGSPLMIHYPLFQEYFLVYRKNAHQLGLVNDDRIRRGIIVTYSLAQGMLDSLQHNNEMIAERVRVQAALGPKIAAYGADQLQGSRDPDFLRIGQLTRQMESYALKIKDGHLELKTSLGYLLPLLEDAVGPAPDLAAGKAADPAA